MFLELCLLRLLSRVTKVDNELGGVDAAAVVVVVVAAAAAADVDESGLCRRASFTQFILIL